MLRLAPIIARIEDLLTEGSAERATYAALEARLALEKVVYDRLRQRHDYISQADLRGWNPRYVINKIIAEVDPHVAETLTFSIGKEAGAETAEDDYVDVGTEIGFDPRRISKLWNALGKLALHVRLPEKRTDEIPDYGDPGLVRAKVEEALAELKRLSTGTMSFSGLGSEVSFSCPCGQLNKRKALLLKDGQAISCLNPDCKRSFIVERHPDGEMYFKIENIEIPCASCGTLAFAPKRELLEMKPGTAKTFACGACEHENQVEWILARANLATDGPAGANAVRHKPAPQ